MTSFQSLGIEPALIGNPHLVPDGMDQVIGARHDIPLYSETCFMTSWNPDNGVGLFLHAGRCRQDIELWSAHALV